MLNNVNFEKIYDDLHDDHVRTIIVYVDTENNNVVHADPECKIPLDAETVFELFNKKMAIGKFKGDDTRYAFPVGLAIDIGGYVKASLVSVPENGGTPTGLWVYSKEVVN